MLNCKKLEKTGINKEFINKAIEVYFNRFSERKERKRNTIKSKRNFIPNSISMKLQFDISNYNIVNENLAESHFATLKSDTLNEEWNNLFEGEINCNPISKEGIL